MARAKKKLYGELNESFPAQFPDDEPERLALMQESMILQIDELLEPDDPDLVSRRTALFYEIQQRSKPAVLSGPNNSLDSMRQAYEDNRTFLQTEHLPVNDQTSCYDFWRSVDFMKRKYKSKAAANHVTTE